MSSTTPEQLLAVDAGRDRPRPARPVTFWTTVVGAPVLALALCGWFVLGDPEPAFGVVSSHTWLAIGVATLLVVAGELTPILGSRQNDPTGVAWSTTFAFATVLFTDVVMAVVLYAGAAVVSGMLARKAVYRWAFNAGQYALSVIAADGVLALFGINPQITGPWAPSSVTDVLVCLLAAGAFFVVNEVLVSVALGALDGGSWLAEFRDTLRFELAANGSQLLIGPLVAVVMLHAPLLTLLAVVPVAAVHRSVAASRASDWTAAHDHLTGLANRARLTAVTAATLQQVRPDAETSPELALFLVDLDRFKEVNDVLGHLAGDRALKEVARRLTESVPEAEVLARLGGDEFAFTVRGLATDFTALTVARRVAAALAEPFSDDLGRLIDLDGSIGVALAPRDGADVESLLSKADVAMYQAKRDSSGVQVFSPGQLSASVTRLGVISSLRRALDAGELRLHFQPKLELRTGALVGAEALVRWFLPDGRVVPPDEFIPVAEQSGIMPHLTAAVVDMALGQAARWRDESGARIPVAVNVSLRDLLQEEFAGTVGTALLRHGVAAEDLTLEVTERVLAGDLQRVSATMRSLRNLGVRLSMDDFGTGWASLQMLRELPFTEVKLDRSFVSRAQESVEDDAVVTMVVRLARALGLTTVAEGVETAEVLRRLTALGCDQAQGWHVARPVPADELLALWSTRPAPQVTGVPAQPGARGGGA